MKTNKKETMLMVLSLSIFAVSPMTMKVSKHEELYPKKGIYRSIAQELPTGIGNTFVTVQDSTYVRLPNIPVAEKKISETTQNEENCDAENRDACQDEAQIKEIKEQAALIKTRQDKIKEQLNSIQTEVKLLTAKLEERKNSFNELTACQDQDTCGHIEIYEKEIKEVSAKLASKLTELADKNEKLHALSNEIEAKKAEAKKIVESQLDEENKKELKAVREELDCLDNEENDLDTLYSQIAELIQNKKAEADAFALKLEQFSPNIAQNENTANTAQRTEANRTTQTESHEQTNRSENTTVTTANNNAETEELKKKIAELEKKLSERQTTTDSSNSTCNTVSNNKDMGQVLQAIQGFAQQQSQLLAAITQQNQQMNMMMMVSLLQGNHNTLLNPYPNGRSGVGEISLSLKDLFSIFPSLTPYQTTNNYYGFNPMNSQNGFTMSTPQQMNANPMFNFSSPMQNSWVYDANLSTPQWGNFYPSSTTAGSLGTAAGNAAASQFGNSYPTGIGQVVQPAYFNGQRI